MSGTRAGALKGWETRRQRLMHRPTKRNEARADVRDHEARLKHIKQSTKGSTEYSDHAEYVARSAHVRYRESMVAHWRDELAAAKKSGNRQKAATASASLKYDQEELKMARQRLRELNGKGR